MASPNPPNSTIRLSAPGKVILHGEHSVVYNKLAVAASLGLRTRLEYSEKVDKKDVIAIDFPSVNMLHFYSVQDMRRFLDKPLPLTKAPSMYNFTHPELLDHERLIHEIRAFVGEKSGSHPLEPNQEIALTSLLYLLRAVWATVDVKIGHFKLVVTSELAVSAGTGSSASFAVILAAFLLHYVRLKNLNVKACYKSFKFANSDLRSFDKSELDLISKWAFQSERIVHGTPSGVDNTICTFGGLVEFRKGSSSKLVELSTKFAMILVNTKVSRDTKRLVAMVADKRQKHKDMLDLVLETMDLVAAKAVDIMKKLNNRMGDDFDVMDGYETLGELADMNQNLLRCLGVSHGTLDEICCVFTQNGLHGKLTGAGGGGYAICLVSPCVDESVVRKVMEDLNSRGFEAILTDLGGCGVSIDTF